MLKTLHVTYSISYTVTGNVCSIKENFLVFTGLIIGSENKRKNNAVLLSVT